MAAPEESRLANGLAESPIMATVSVAIALEPATSFEMPLACEKLAGGLQDPRYQVEDYQRRWQHRCWSIPLAPQVSIRKIRERCDNKSTKMAATVTSAKSNRKLIKVISSILVVCYLIVTPASGQGHRHQQQQQQQQQQLHLRPHQHFQHQHPQRPPWHPNNHRQARYFQEQAQVLPPPPPPPPPHQQPGRPYPHPHPAHSVLVPGNTNRQDQEKIVTQVIVPHDSFRLEEHEEGSEQHVSHIIDHKRFVESVNSRCFASTQMEDPLSVEPTFVIIKPNGEAKLNATVQPEQILRSGFNPQLATTIFIHGFTQSYPETEWLRKTRALFEKHALVSRHNLIIMDWGLGSSAGGYSAVAARVSGMGSFLANFLMKLIDLGQDRMRIHLIGHSLGAHLAGFAGKRIRPRIGRITALDPAGPCFGKFFSNSPTDRLSPDDAYEVDVYHYDDNFLGLPGQHGQFDVYVNGGSTQPGCKADVNAMFQALVTVVFRRNRVLSESHTRSTEVATSQLSLSGCQQVAYECRDFNAFVAGECGKCDEQNNQCFFMGFPHQYSDPDSMLTPLRTSFPGKRFYILTGQNELFCANHYQILVKFEPTPEMAQLSKKHKWRIQAELINDLHGRVNVTITNQMAPNVFSYLLLTDATRPMRIVGAHLRVQHSDGTPVHIWQPNQHYKQQGEKSKFHVHRILHMEVNFMSHMSAHGRRIFSSRLCPAHWSPLKPPQPPSPQDENSIDSDGWLAAMGPSSKAKADLPPLQMEECMPLPPPSRLN